MHFAFYPFSYYGFAFYVIKIGDDCANFIAISLHNCRCHCGVKSATRIYSFSFGMVSDGVKECLYRRFGLLFGLGVNSKQ